MFACLKYKKMADPSANYVFLPWVRQGAAAGIKTTDMTAGQPAVVSVTVNLRVNQTPAVEQPVRLYGPGDVIGIDQQQIVRTEPRPQSTDFEPNYFAAIEFDRPDFPWLFTPAKADSGKLRPWLCLIVVRKQKGVTISVNRDQPLPILEITSPAERDLELPDLSESWAWAHVQVARTAPNETSLRTSLGGDPALTVSRLLCPRRLDPLTDYVACVVPAFELGRRAGLGELLTADDEKPPLAPAWVIKSAPAPVTLPIYFHWEFRTGTGGDFESLAVKLKARELSAEVGKRPMDISNPGFHMTDMPPNAGKIVLGLEGALRAVDSKPDQWLDDVRKPFQNALKKILNTPWEVATKENPGDPIVGPPIYGCWQAARHSVESVPPASPTSLNWLDELNLDPRHRAAAALGTQVVQTQQEQLVASAWEQLGEIERLNQMRRQAQLARAVNSAYHSRHFAKFSAETLLKVLAPAQSRIVVEPARTGDPRMLFAKTITQSRIPSTAISAPLRRLASPRGVISSRFTTAGAPPIGIIARLNTTTPTLLLALVSKPLGGLVTLDRVSENQSGQFGTPLRQTVVFARVSQAIANTPPLVDFTIAPEGSAPRSLLNFNPGPPDSRNAQLFRNAVKPLQDYLTQVFTPPKTGDAKSPVNLLDKDTNLKLLESVNPEKTIHARVKASQVLAGAAEPAVDQLEPFLDAPSFPQPMYEALRDLSQDYLFSGLEQVPSNSVALLETNPEFVEAFLIGLNAEMSSELLWRNYPTDQRNTFFQQFWDTSVGNAQRDIQPIAEWNGRHLGKNAPNTNGKLVLLIRGELLRRYPNSVIYAVRAVKPTPTARLDVSRKAEDESHPLFRGTLKPDVTFLGFDLTEDEATGKAPHKPEGWFFVIQQQPTEPRFGLDVADFEKADAPALTTWDDLSWRHLGKTESELKALTHASAKTVMPSMQGMTWGKNSAHQAFITLQRPVRIAIHARQMIANV